MEFSSNLSAIYTKWCAQTFPPIFRIFAIFDRDFAKIVAPPGDENWSLLSCWKGNPFREKVKTESKSTHKPWRNTCWKYAPSKEQRGGRPSVTNRKINIQTPHFITHDLPKLCMGIEDVETILKGANHFSIQRIVFFYRVHWKIEVNERRAVSLQ